jgi:hypothetical protein
MKRRRRRVDKCIHVVRLGEKAKVVGALDRRAKLRRKGVQRMDYIRLEQNGKVKYVRGEETLIVPSHEACKERLIKLLEETGGDVKHQAIAEFWAKQEQKQDTDDLMKREWARECWGRLCQAWEALVTPPEEDFFAGL